MVCIFHKQGLYIYLFIAISFTQVTYFLKTNFCIALAKKQMEWVKTFFSPTFFTLLQPHLMTHWWHTVFVTLNGWKEKMKRWFPPNVWPLCVYVLTQTERSWGSHQLFSFNQEWNKGVTISPISSFIQVHSIKETHKNSPCHWSYELLLKEGLC